MTRTAAIIGGGWAGMAAAVVLARQGIAVSVFESAKTLGGRARSVELDGVAVDNGQHILLGAYRDTLSLIDLVNPDAATHLQRLPLALGMPPDFLLRTPALPAPLHLLAGLLSAKGLDLTDRLRALGLLIALRRMKFALTQDMSLTALLTQYKQTARLNRFLWHPLCVAALNTPPEEASAQIFLNVLRDAFSRARADSDLVLPRVNLSELFPLPAAAFVEAHGGSVHTSSRVTHLASEENAWSLHVGETVHRFPQVICAMPPQRSAELLEPLIDMQPLADVIRALHYQPIYTIYLQYPAGTRLDAPMLGLSQGLGQWVFDRGQLGGPDGLLAVVISARGAHESLEHDELAQLVTGELASSLDLGTAPLWHRVIAEKRATFSCSPDLARPPARTPLPGLYLAGDYVAGSYPATLEGAVRSGLQCARFLLESS